MAEEVQTKAKEASITYFLILMGLRIFNQIPVSIAQHYICFGQFAEATNSRLETLENNSN